MMDTVDALMVLLFPFLDTIPFTMPRYWIFRGRLRISFRYVVLVQFVLTAACGRITAPGSTCAVGLT